MSILATETSARKKIFLLLEQLRNQNVTLKGSYTVAGVGLQPCDIISAVSTNNYYFKGKYLKF
jgi:hypothetical protein